MGDFAFPDDLVAAQRELDAVRADLARAVATLPWSVEPAPGFRQSKADGYWSNRELPDSPGWGKENEELVAGLRRRQVALAETVVTHPFWNTLSGPDRVAARTALKHLNTVSPSAAA
ncbi:hypothetical protein ABT112_26870 [Streptomyces sp. NPDC002055]|uniref:hypothetical protein n=1 Tax=Streptomyces sp. NPDC002055 TaxID=3154534 RepID=UPI00332B94A2